MVSISKIRCSNRSFKILALPLARLPKSTPNGSTSTSTSNSTSPSTSTENDQNATPKPKTPLMYYQIIQPDPIQEDTKGFLTKKFEWAMDTASSQWLKLGEKKKDSYSYWIYRKGEKLMDKIEFEEWALKNVKEGQGVKILGPNDKGTQEKIKIELLKPNFQEQPLPPLLPKLHSFLIHRIPHHKSMMWKSIAVSPVTWPFAIIPIVPNFPLFYVLWRAWSHYRAWRGAVYLDSLLKQGMIIETPSKDLDRVYEFKGQHNQSGLENVAPDQTVSKDSSTSPTKGDYQIPDEIIKDGENLVAQAKGQDGSIDGTATPKSMVYSPDHVESKDQKSDLQGKTLQVKQDSKGAIGIQPVAKHPSLLLKPNQVPLLAEIFQLKPLEIIDLDRAVEQADLRARKIDAANKEKK